ncbi:hypothetical protein CDD80_5660 [Ophiocordyceps camponoti-rufipedis]|uniref:EXS domain-containing protein n=1 Tax=Ophiocordyceps camponoti-rufipedis TaxID=2004952 RepID=A0A2C5YTG7_9HYPO|nr:hypothetical protein CDD80_5660 [Ophiocordyceps camponoti-rufipedis]
MDGDAAVEPQLDSFSLVFPLPYRVGFIVTLAVWGWGLNLQYLGLVKIDVPALIRYPGRPLSHHVAPYASTYRLATALSCLLGLSISLFWLLTWRVPSRVIAYDWLPMSYLVALVAIFLVPHRSLPTTGRRRLLAMLRRVSLGGIAETHEGKFGDILLADVLTSYAKVCGDLFVTVCMFLTPGGSSTDRPDRNCGGAVIVPLLMALPSLIRLRQCITEYLRVRRASYKESTGWGGQHLANALKYSTAFPVIITSSLQRNLPGETTKTALNRAWLVAVLVNSLYSFYWDVAKDWDMTLFSARWKRNSPYHAWGLRDRLIFRPVGLYYAVIVLDLALRCTWSMKLSPHLYRFSDFESGIFLIEVLEVLRRWLWIFFRVETEWIRNSLTGVGVDDILLGDYQGKDDDDD